MYLHTCLWISLVIENIFSLPQSNPISQARQRRIENKNQNSQKETKAAQDVAESSALPNGVDSLVPLTPTGFCIRQIEGKIQAADGTQFKTGGTTCSSNLLGLIPSEDRMVSTIITNPADGATINAGQENIVEIDTLNLVSGFFSDANTQYYLAPQTIQGGSTQGHQHITIQKMNGKEVLDPKTFAFFKGIDDAAVDKQQRSLSAVVPPGTIKENGQYRICSITGSATHQPILSPVQVRGPQDDCIRINVVGARGSRNDQIADDNAENQEVTAGGKKVGIGASKNTQPQAQQNKNQRQAQRDNNQNRGQQNKNQRQAQRDNNQNRGQRNQLI